MTTHSPNGPLQLLTNAELDALLDAHRQREREQARWDRSDVTGMTDLHPASDGRPESTLEQRFPHVAQRLTIFWRSHACAEYIRQLLVMDREERRGFPPEVVADLLMLDELNDRVTRLGSLDLSAGKPRR